MQGLFFYAASNPRICEFHGERTSLRMPPLPGTVSMINDPRHVNNACLPDRAECPAKYKPGAGVMQPPRRRYYRPPWRITIGICGHPSGTIMNKTQPPPHRFRATKRAVVLALWADI